MKSLWGSMNINLKTLATRWGHLKKCNLKHGHTKFGNSWNQFSVLAFSTFRVGKHFCVPFITFFFLFFFFFWWPSFYFPSLCISCFLSFLFYTLFHFYILRDFFFQLCLSSFLSRFILILFSRAELRSDNDTSACNAITKLLLSKLHFRGQAVFMWLRN